MASPLEKLTLTLEDLSEAITAKLGDSARDLGFGGNSSSTLLDMNNSSHSQFSLHGEAMALSAREDDADGLMDPENFRNLQMALRRRGCVTNTYLQMNVHKYVQHVRNKKERELSQRGLLPEEDLPEVRQRRNS